MKTLYLECYAGISGDMSVGALLDLGADEQGLRAALESLGVEGFHIKTGRTQKCGISAFDFDVLLEDPHTHEEEHMHEHLHEAIHGEEDAHKEKHKKKKHDKKHEKAEELDAPHLHSHAHVSAAIHALEQEHTHAHMHEHTHEHMHDHMHAHTHPHIHRNLEDITRIIDRGALTPGARETALRIFRRVAEAEAKVHGLPIDQVHFHEVGAVDSIVDIVSAAYCLDNLGIDRVVCSSLYEGKGTVLCQHGVMPVPAPATAEIAARAGLLLHITDNNGEMVTPTGAAIAGEAVGGPPAAFRILKTGYGAGKRDYPHANVLRAHLIEEAAEEDKAGKTDWSGFAGGHTDRVLKLECNLDNMTGEQLGYAMEQLFLADALDVWFTPIQMKKNRPAALLSVLCAPENARRVTECLLRHTGTLGVRGCMTERVIMHRSFTEAQTAYGEIKVKQAAYPGIEKLSAEFESAKEAAIRQNIPIKEVYSAAESSKK